MLKLIRMCNVCGFV